MGKFILYFSDGKYTFAFYTSSGDKIAVGPPFITKSSAQQAISEVRLASRRVHLYRKRESHGQYYFELYSKTQKLLLVSKKYESREDRDFEIALMENCGSKAGYIEMIF